MSAPRLLHKYLGGGMHAVENIAQGRLKFTPVDQLNDPAELVAALRPAAIRRSLQELRAGKVTDVDVAALQDQMRLLVRLAPSKIKAAAPQTCEAIVALANAEIFEDESFLERPRELAGIFRDSTAILSLTDNPDDLRMWASYGSTGAGWLVTFRDIEAAFADRALPGLYTPLPANYDPDDPGVTFRPDSFLSFFTKKHPEWSGEREWRVVCPLDDCDVSNPDVPLISIDPAHVYAMTAGWAVTDEAYEAVRSKLLSLNPELHMAKLALNDARRPALPEYLTDET